MTRIVETLKAMDKKRIVLFALGPAVLTLAGDAAIAHFAGREMAHPAQLAPVLVGPAAALVVMAGARARLQRTLARLTRIAGGVLAALGAVGTGFHLRALLRLLAGQKLAWDTLQTALAAAPPLFAPGAFLGLGAALWLLANPALHIAVDAPPATARATQLHRAA
jgi:hypothetical protein